MYNIKFRRIYASEVRDSAFPIDVENWIVIESDANAFPEGYEVKDEARVLFLTTLFKDRGPAFLVQIHEVIKLSKECPDLDAYVGLSSKTATRGSFRQDTVHIQVRASVQTLKELALLIKAGRTTPEASS